ncbi:hypothetical protein, partial [Vibrio breoganii]|uniref:hypothetical protein n=1 Tax=Vibrio breoganii TaxID=553239 RepID=UPI000584E341
MTVIFGLWCKVQTKKNRIIEMIRFLMEFGSPCKTCTGRPTGCDISTVHKVLVKKNRIIEMIRFLRNLAPPARLELATYGLTVRR